MVDSSSTVAAATSAHSSYFQGLLDVSVKWSTRIEGHFPLLESSTL
ncbi:hypothetical protein T12_2060 [Trichinella patagoniensis]|uniref:Uncharacterized protein n=1 Tax=Trichinella patagoniensis TaxID=990121 RepID=A0A0V0YPD5_9BILA|nr:hypothetical protein T12_3541 [Trichinella patagoniensis]KRY02174.1 hypothetical protein T12_114 [Trichinella patagoniensis]KRY02574.1 hypothetical protein T12_2060 [Trichinella patagoniensis]